MCNYVSIPISGHYVVHLKLTQCYMLIISIKLEEKKRWPRFFTTIQKNCFRKLLKEFLLGKGFRNNHRWIEIMATSRRQDFLSQVIWVLLYSSPRILSGEWGLVWSVAGDVLCFFSPHIIWGSQHLRCVICYTVLESYQTERCEKPTYLGSPLCLLGSWSWNSRDKG